MDARRRRSRAEKEAIVAELNASGASVSAVARKYNVSASLLFRWRKQFGSDEPKTARAERSFVPVVLSAPQRGRGAKAMPTIGSGSGLIEIELVGGRRIRFDQLVDPAALKRVIDAVEGRPVCRSPSEGR
jgi:transposase